MLEETLRAEAQVLRDMLSTYDTDDFMRRLSARIEQTPTRSQRVQTAPPDATVAPPSFDTPGLRFAAGDGHGDAR
ncbi:hypothetical protein ACFV8T_37840 [Streptomyces sp. NPDC059832]|uniref:hypothetical protein n=1 Tax=unclassified Streptomyces TaxID=2593676 RepID=UPI00364D1F89